MRTLLALTFLVAACGDDGVHHLADGPLAIDASSADAGPDAFVSHEVSLTVTANGAPAAGVNVYFQTTDSTLVLATMTDATGVAKATMPAGGFVTALEPTNVNTGLPTINSTVDTFAGVKPGDNLHLDLFGQPSTSTPVTFELTVPTDAAAANYNLFTSCGQANVDPPAQLVPAVGNNPPVSVTLYSCNGTADMLLVTTDANGQVHSSIYQAAVPVVDAGTVTLTGSYVAVPQTTFAYTNVPASFGGFNLQQTIVSPLSPSLYVQFANATVTAGAGNTTMSIPTATGTIGVTESDGYPNGGAFSLQTVLQWGPLSATYALDVSTVALPDYASTPVFDQPTHTLSWIEGTATAQTADFVFGEYYSFRSGTPSNHSWFWNIIAPRTAASSVTYPTLPTDIFDFNAGANDSLTVEEVLNVKVPGGYDAIRAHAYDIVNGDYTGLVASPTGTAVIEDSITNIGLAHAPRHLHATLPTTRR